jgi:hypothetical protein
LIYEALFCKKKLHTSSFPSHGIHPHGLEVSFEKDSIMAALKN